MFDSHKLHKTKRMGLSIIKKIFLQQRYFYLLGLQKLLLSEARDSSDDAIVCLLKSLELGNI